MSNDNKDTKLYQHKTAQECTAFCVRIKAKARRHSNDDVGAIAVGTTLTGENADTRRAKAKADYFDLIVDALYLFSRHKSLREVLRDPLDVRRDVEFDPG